MVENEAKPHVKPASDDSCENTKKLEEHKPTQAELEEELKALIKEFEEKNSELLETERDVSRLEEELKEKKDSPGQLKQAVGETACPTTSPREECASHETGATVPSKPDRGGAAKVSQATTNMRVSFKPGCKDEDPYALTATDPQGSKSAIFRSLFADGINMRVLKGSALSQSMPIQIIMYLVALGGVVFVLVATAEKLGGSEDDEHHRLLGGASSAPAASSAPTDGSPSLLMKDIAFSLTGAGLVALIVNVLKLPLILGYLLGGVLVGPIGLKIVASQADIADVSSLGLVFLLFMIGLELDLRELLKMGKVVLCTGFLQFPLCSMLHIGIFMGLEAMGISLGPTSFSVMYCGVCCGISSTMIVAKLLGERGEMDSQPGRLTIGILIFQDIWAIVVLAIQPKIDAIDPVEIMVTFAKIICLIIVAILYAKFVMPAMLFFASKSVELMLVTSLSWCFFIACVAILPFVGQSVELASLIAGAALATFPYSAEFNGKIKYIRDFFITLFFVGSGMTIPVPSFSYIFRGALVALVVMVVRWLGIFLVVLLVGGGSRLACLATLNLSQISEFALVICTLGVGLGHVDNETLTILIWTFSGLALQSTYLIGYKVKIYKMLTSLAYKCRRNREGLQKAEAHEEHDHGDDERDIILLGFHKVAHMLIAECKTNNQQLLQKVHVIHFDQDVKEMLENVGVKFSYGDISSPDVLEHCHHGVPKIVLSTIPDSMLMGLNNNDLLQVMQAVWPTAAHVVTGESPVKAKKLYNEGAGYVLRMEKLCAERLGELLNDQFVTGRSSLLTGGMLMEIFEQYKTGDQDRRGVSVMF